MNENISVFLDESLKRFDTVFPACGSSNSAIEVNMEELEEYSGACEWVDVCKIGRRRRVDSGRTGARISRNQDAYKPG